METWSHRSMQNPQVFVFLLFPVQERLGWCMHPAYGSVRGWLLDSRPDKWGVGVGGRDRALFRMPVTRASLG